MASGWKRCDGGLVKGDLYIESGVRGGRLIEKRSKEQYENEHGVEWLHGEPWGDPSYGVELEAGPIADLKFHTDDAKGHWYTR